MELEPLAITVFFNTLIRRTDYRRLLVNIFAHLLPQTALPRLAIIIFQIIIIIIINYDSDL